MDCRILAVTSRDDDIVRERFMEAGADLFLTKPLNAGKLARALQNI